MWKKALWIYLGLFVLGVVVLGGIAIVEEIRNGEFTPDFFIGPIIMFIPPAVVATGLRDKKDEKIPLWRTLFYLLLVFFSLLLMLLFTAGTIEKNAIGNSVDLISIGKALLFVPMIIGLIYVGYKRLLRKSTKETETSS
jgi:hypothetical protein